MLSKGHSAITKVKFIREQEKNIKNQYKFAIDIYK